MRAFLDTTILTDALLKREEGARARAAIRSYTDGSLLPVYAIKEFKAGPLSNYKYFYNKLVMTKSAGVTIKALQALSRTPSRYLTSTSLEALAQSYQAVTRISPAELARRYPGGGSADAALTDLLRLETKRLILSAWNRRRSVASETVCPLPCYTEEKPYEDRRGLLKLDPKGCKNDVECGLSVALKADLGVIERLHQAVKRLPESPEIIRRRKALREIERKPRSPLGEGVCKALGDAVFAILAPPGSVILTTNLKDHAPLAAALGKSAEAPP